jgi:hypothetical protein
VCMELLRITYRKEQVNPSRLPQQAEITGVAQVACSVLTVKVWLHTEPLLLQDYRDMLTAH